MNKLFYKNIINLQIGLFVLEFACLGGLFAVPAFCQNVPRPVLGGQPTVTRGQAGSGAFNGIRHQGWPSQIRKYHQYYGQPQYQPYVYPGFNPGYKQSNRRKFRSKQNQNVPAHPSTYAVVEPVKTLPAQSQLKKLDLEQEVIE